MREWPSPGGPKSQPYADHHRERDRWYSESNTKPNTIVRFDPKTEKFQTWAIPSGGGVVRNMVHTPDGQPVDCVQWHESHWRGPDKGRHKSFAKELTEGPCGKEHRHCPGAKAPQFPGCGMSRLKPRPTKQTRSTSRRLARPQKSDVVDEAATRPIKQFTPPVDASLGSSAKFAKIRVDGALSRSESLWEE